MDGEILLCGAESAQSESSYRLINDNILQQMIIEARMVFENICLLSSMLYIFGGEQTIHLRTIWKRFLS